MSNKEKIEFDAAVHGDDLKKLIEEASDHLLTIESYQTLIKDIRDRAKDELGCEGKMFNKVLKLHHKKIREQFESENDEVLGLYDELF